MHERSRGIIPLFLQLEGFSPRHDRIKAVTKCGECTAFCRELPLPRMCIPKRSYRATENNFLVRNTQRE